MRIAMFVERSLGGALNELSEAARREMERQGF
jgi:hypothetical protein